VHFTWVGVNCTFGVSMTYLLATQVRDGACLATASCALAYPEECRPWLEVLFPLWKRQLDDNVWSVRAHAAMALADVVRAYQQPALDVVVPCLRCICSTPIAVLGSIPFQACHSVHVFCIYSISRLL
jgi:hypothetical protein